MTQSKRILLIISMALVALALFSIPANAAPTEGESPNISQGLFADDNTRLPDDSQGHYRIDLAEDAPAEDEGFLDSITSFNPIGNMVEENAMTVQNMVINIVLKWNMLMTNIMIYIVQFSFDTQIIGSWIGVVEPVVQDIAGVNISGTTGGGLFGALLGLAGLSVGVAAFYQLVVRQAPLGGITHIVRGVGALVIALVIIGYFGPLMKGANTISSEMSAAILTGGASQVIGEGQTREQVRDQIGDNLWQEFIVRPYLVLQYGTDDVEEVGEERVMELLALPPGDERAEYVAETEVAERGNTVMTYSEMETRLAFTIVYSLINMAVSVPIFALCLALLIFQVWFLIIAFYTPFALVQSIFPGQFPVLKRYAIELMYPLVLKFIATIMTMIVFALGFLIYKIPVTEAFGMAQYLVSAVMQFVIFSALFLLSGRIYKIMSAGSRGPFEALRNDLNGLKGSMDHAATQMGKVGKVVGSAALGAATGGAGSAAGAAAVKYVQSRNDEPADHQPAHTKPVATIKPKDTPLEPEAATATHTRPMVNLAKEPKEAVATPQETAQEPAQPTTTVAESKHPQPAEAAKEQPAAEERDLSKPMGRISEYQQNNYEINVKDKEAEKDRVYKKGGE